MQYFNALKLLRFLSPWQKKPVQDSWHAAAYLRQNVLIMHSSSSTHTGQGVSSIPVLQISVNAPEAEIGAKIRFVLSSSRCDAERCDDQGENNPVLQAAGVRNWATLERESRLALIELRNHRIQFFPMQSISGKRKSKGFTGVNGASIEVPNECSDHELGKALLKALDRSVAWSACT